VDLKTNEILGLWRGFLRTLDLTREKGWWLSAQACPGIVGDNTEFSEFVMEVLKP